MIKTLHDITVKAQLCGTARLWNVIMMNGKPMAIVAHNEAQARSYAELQYFQAAGHWLGARNAEMAGAYDFA